MFTPHDSRLSGLSVHAPVSRLCHQIVKNRLFSPPWKPLCKFQVHKLVSRREPERDLRTAAASPSLIGVGGDHRLRTETPRRAPL